MSIKRYAIISIRDLNFAVRFFTIGIAGKFIELIQASPLAEPILALVDGCFCASQEAGMGSTGNKDRRTMNLYRHIATTINSGKFTGSTCWQDCIKRWVLWGHRRKPRRAKKTFSGDEGQITDLLCSYNLHTNSKDEQVLDHAPDRYRPYWTPEVIVYVVDLRYLHQQLLFLTQVPWSQFSRPWSCWRKNQVNDESPLRWKIPESRQGHYWLLAPDSDTPPLHSRKRLRSDFWRMIPSHRNEDPSSLPEALGIEGESDALKARSLLPHGCSTSMKRIAG